MKDNKTVLQQYKLYVNTIHDCNANMIPMYFNKLTDFVKKHCEDENLRPTILYGCIHETLVQVRKNNLSLKSCSMAWNKSKTDELFNYLYHLNGNISKGSDKPYNQSEFNLDFNKLMELIDNEQDPSLQLYMHLKHEESECGKDFYKKMAITAAKLLKCSTDEEIKAILKSEW